MDDLVAMNSPRASGRPKAAMDDLVAMNSLDILEALGSANKQERTRSYQIEIL